MSQEAKAIEIEGARRMQNAIIALLMVTGHMDMAQKVLVMKPEDICKGESIKESFTIQ